MVTIRDVAQAAGVSTSTVSRVLDERLPQSSSAAAERVRRAARELGYVRNPLASGLRRSGTGTIGVVVPRLTDTVMAMLYEHIAAACAERGIVAVVATTEDDPEAERHAIDSLLRRRVDGLVLTTARQDVEPATGVGNVPVVLALRTDGQHPASVGDDELGARLATRHLLDLGHRQIGLVSGPQYASSAQRRTAGYRRALDAADVALRSELVVGDSFSMEAGEAAGKALLELAKPPTAIFAVNDNTAIGVLAAAHRLGLRVPEDLSIVGYNDIPVVSRLPIPLTTVRVPFEQIARGAVDLLFNAAPADPRTITTTPALIPRRTTAPPAA